MKKSTLLHLRIPFSYYLSPTFVFAVSLSPGLDWFRISLMFVILHIFLYPASNAFNSYYDRDTGSIGGLEKPPPVDEELLRVSLAFDGMAVALGLLLDWKLAVALLIYGFCSKAYSYTKIRLKKYPVISWLGVSLFQGGYTFLMTYYAVNDLAMKDLMREDILLPAIISSLFLMGSYPITQVYQHEEDRRRGDLTLSILLGIKGTFLFTALVFSCAVFGFMMYYQIYYRLFFAVLFMAMQFPVLIVFLTWFLRVLKNESKADFRSTMRMNMVSSSCLNIFFILFMLLNMQ